MAPTCPECGLVQPAAVPRLAGATRFTRSLTWLVALAAAVLSVAATYRTHIFSTGEYIPRYVDADGRPETLRAIAAGAPEPHGLADAFVRATQPIQPFHPGDAKLYVAFGDGPAVRTDRSTWGFPFAIVIHERAAAYDDPITRTGFRPAATHHDLPTLHAWERPSSRLPIAPPRPRWSWWPGFGGWLVHQPPPEETAGAVVTTRIRASGLFLAAATAVLGTVVISSVWRRLRGSSSRRRRLAASLAIAACLVLALSLVRVKRVSDTGWPQWAQSQQVNTPPQPVFWGYNGFAELPITRGELRAFADAPDADQRLARAILEAVPNPTPGVLVVWAVEEARLPPTGRGVANAYELVIGGFYRYDYETHPLFGPTRKFTFAAPLAVEYNGADLFIAYSSRGDLMLARLNLPALLAVLAVFVAARYALLILIRAVGGFRRRRRRRRGQCTGCAYPLA